MIARSTVWRRNNVERARAQGRKSRAKPEVAQHYRKYMLGYMREWRRRDKRRRLCHDAVRRALKTGELVKPKRCECAGCKLPPRVAHHESYDHPLVVVWMCDPHHTKRHQEMRSHRIKP